MSDSGRLIDKPTRDWIRKRLTKRYRRLRGKFARRLARHLPAVSKQIHAKRYRDAERKIVGLAGRPRPILPDFIIIGSPKCGTSWLRSVLDQHPEVVTVHGEIEYFSTYSYYPVEWYYERLARPLAYKKVRRMTSCVFGEKSAHYSSLPTEQIRRVRDLLPDVRLILMARDPVVRHWAHAKKHFAKRRLRNPDTAVLDTPRNELIDFFEREQLLGEFSKIVANWCSVFPDRQLLVISQEKTWETPRAIFDAVLEHIGAPTGYDPEKIPLLFEKKNQGPKVEMPRDVAEILESMFESERQWLGEFFRDRAFVTVP